MEETYKTPAGRLREFGAREILRLRDLEPKPTYQAIAMELGVSIGTVFNVVTGRTWPWLGGRKAIPVDTTIGRNSSPWAK